VAANERRREARQLRAYATVASREPAQDEAVGIDRFGGAREEFVSALGQLKRQDRDALLLFAWGDLGYAEIAEALGIPVGTVRSRINRARRRVRDVMSPDGSGAPLTEGRYNRA
jgi:RNA polymerase sigma factor (sigma-70 family)